MSMKLLQDFRIDQYSEATKNWHTCSWSEQSFAFYKSPNFQKTSQFGGFETGDVAGEHTGDHSIAGISKALEM